MEKNASLKNFITLLLTNENLFKTVKGNKIFITNGAAESYHEGC